MALAVMIQLEALNKGVIEEENVGPEAGVGTAWMGYISLEEIPLGKVIQKRRVPLESRIER